MAQVPSSNLDSSQTRGACCAGGRLVVWFQQAGQEWDWIGPRYQRLDKDRSSDMRAARGPPILDGNNR